MRKASRVCRLPRQDNSTSTSAESCKYTSWLNNGHFNRKQQYLTAPNFFRATTRWQESIVKRWCRSNDAPRMDVLKVADVTSSKYLDSNCSKYTNSNLNPVALFLFPLLLNSECMRFAKYSSTTMD